MPSSASSMGPPAPWVLRGPALSGATCSRTRCMQPRDRTSSSFAKPSLRTHRPSSAARCRSSEAKFLESRRIGAGRYSSSSPPPSASFLTGLHAAPPPSASFLTGLCAGACSHQCRVKNKPPAAEGSASPASSLPGFCHRPTSPSPDSASFPSSFTAGSAGAIVWEGLCEEGTLADVWPASRRRMSMMRLGGGTGAGVGPGVGPFIQPPPHP
mmetsp:Transcript_57236/g.179279  ORF Transcript_57236/g.179279 Transcript_57236/m.179279 type:complete len:212 (-) Transcript_57236:526-1161(-)